MTAGRPGDPDGRTLARWWDQISRLRPRGLWAGPLDLTHLDAPVRTRQAAPLDPLRRLLLRAVEAAAPATLDRLDARLGLGRGPLFQWLRDLERAGLVQGDSGHYALTAAGTPALASGEAPRLTAERRRFTFATVPGGEPHFLPWRPPPGPAGPPTALTLSHLTTCIDRPAEWKRRYGFPEDIVAVERPDPSLPPAEAWRRIAVARTERVPVVLAVTAGDGPERLLGFTAGAGDLDPGAPALVLESGWSEPFPELAREPSADELRAAWRDWCAAQGLTAADADACALTWTGGVLRVQSPAAWRDRIAAAGGLLIGPDRLRRAARVEWDGGGTGG